MHLIMQRMGRRGEGVGGGGGGRVLLMAFGEGNSLHNIMIVKTEGVYKTPDFN